MPRSPETVKPDHRHGEIVGLGDVLTDSDGPFTVYSDIPTLLPEYALPRPPKEA